MNIGSVGANTFGLALAEISTLRALERNVAIEFRPIAMLYLALLGFVGSGYWSEAQAADAKLMGCWNMESSIIYRANGTNERPSISCVREYRAKEYFSACTRAGASESAFRYSYDTSGTGRYQYAMVEANGKVVTPRPSSLANYVISGNRLRTTLAPDNPATARPELKVVRIEQEFSRAAYSKCATFPPRPVSKLTGDSSRPPQKGSDPTSKPTPRGDTPKKPGSPSAGSPMDL